MANTTDIIITSMIDLDAQVKALNTGFDLQLEEVCMDDCGGSRLSPFKVYAYSDVKTLETATFCDIRNALERIAKTDDLITATVSSDDHGEFMVNAFNKYEALPSGIKRR